MLCEQRRSYIVLFIARATITQHNNAICSTLNNNNIQYLYSAIITQCSLAFYSTIIQNLHRKRSFMQSLLKHYIGNKIANVKFVKTLNIINTTLLRMRCNCYQTQNAKWVVLPTAIEFSYVVI